MSAIGSVQIAGRVHAAPGETELNTLARRFTLRPGDFDLCGAYCVAGTQQLLNTSSTSGGIVTNESSNSMLASWLFRCIAQNVVYVVKRVTLSAGAIGGAGTTTISFNYPSFWLFRMHGLFNGPVPVLGDAMTTTNSLRILPGYGGNLKSSMRDTTADIVMPPLATSSGTLINNPSSLGQVPASFSTMPTSGPQPSPLAFDGNNSGGGPAGNYSGFGSAPFPQYGSEDWPLGGQTGNRGSTVAHFENMIDARFGDSPFYLNGGEGLALMAGSTEWTGVASLNYWISVQCYWEEYEMRIAKR